ncbi:glycerophosphodiester phosphodiesterase [Segetibacter aerophilus]|uniref:Glycerophosphoryl diester phosphodiesterase n=1 Tax=Segetibacter aerophilus TaxID=670293 RepID=A0A512BH19_9BACT|nr:glycerophosphodiester phosphodiesterase [Segetibacter aerophilus]GEO11266.1 glycerophosphoryl diester phosphodiesterase [Segetibacter aerophilus]
MTFDWQAHRGGRGIFPENTIPAMLHAVDLGVTTLEMDAMITKDKQVIVSHDPYFNPAITTKPDGSYLTAGEEKQLVLYQMTYDEISRFDVGMKVHPQFPQQKKLKAVKPRLADLIDSVETYTKARNLPAKFYNIETKSKATTDNLHHPPPAEFVELLVQVIKAKHIESRTIIQSFDVRTIQYLHQKYRSIKTAYLVEGTGTLQDRLSKLGFTPTIYSPEFHLVDQQLIADCKKLGMQIIPWTVNDVSKMKQLKEWGVDGIITDFPNLAF